MDKTAENMRVGHARADITPPLGVPMAGYGVRKDRGCEGIEEPLQADALYMEGEGGRAVVISADLCGIDEGWGSRVRERVGSDLGLPPSHVVLLGSHTHFGPAAPRGESAGSDHTAWLEQMVRKMTAAAGEAAAAAVPCILRTGSADATDAMYNRRLRAADGRYVQGSRLVAVRTAEERYEPFRGSLADRAQEKGATLRPVDPKLAVLRFDALDGHPIALVVSVGIHPVVGGVNGLPNFYWISPDYPGVLRRTVEGAMGAPAAFWLGTAGNTVPASRGVEQRERIGRLLAGIALQAAETSMPSEEPIRLRVSHDRVGVPGGPPPDSEEGDGSVESVPFELTAIHLGEVGLACLPGEIFAETGLLLQARSPFPRTLVLSLANQSTGYLATRTAFWEGGYEFLRATRHDGLGVSSEAAVVEHTLQLLLEAWESGQDTESRES